LYGQLEKGEEDGREKEKTFSPPLSIAFLFFFLEEKDFQGEQTRQGIEKTFKVLYDSSQIEFTCLFLGTIPFNTQLMRGRSRFKEERKKRDREKGINPSLSPLFFPPPSSSFFTPILLQRKDLSSPTRLFRSISFCPFFFVTDSLSISSSW